MQPIDFGPFVDGLRDDVWILMPMPFDLKYAVRHAVHTPVSVLVDVCIQQVIEAAAEDCDLDTDGHHPPRKPRCCQSTSLE